MSIVGPDGAPTEAGSKLLLAIKAGFSTADAISQMSGLPSFVVINGLREMERFHLVRRSGDGYELDEKGKDLLS
jgi:predicted transcriptional regulator